MEYTCKDCFYANFNKDDSVSCDKKVLLTGKMCEIEKEKVDKSCPSHSEQPIENWRYVENRKVLSDCDDSCEICNRLVNLNDISQYGYIEVQDKNGKIIGERMQCKICRHKGRR